MALELIVPSVGESVSEVELGSWLKREGDPVRKDEAVAIIETDKATMEIFAPADGTLGKVLKPQGAKLRAADVIGVVEVGVGARPANAPAPAPPPEPEQRPSGGSKPAIPRPQPDPRIMPAAARVLAQSGLKPVEVEPTGPGGRMLKADATRAAVSAAAAAVSPAPQPVERAAPVAPVPSPPAVSGLPGEGGDEEVVPMSLIRRKIAERLLQAQSTMALLTTFNEVDLSAVIALRGQFQERFQERYQAKLGFMSFFVKATIEALKDCPGLNAEVRDQSIVYRNYFDIGVAIGGGRGLVVPVLRRAERLSFAQIEQAIADFGKRAKANQLQPDELVGGTFTITNGGVYGSLLSTPLINAPQSGVLGMHAVQDRPVAREGQVVIRPMMYLALTYDHRLVDGREAVTFLRRVKDLVEQPARMLLEV